MGYLAYLFMYKYPKMLLRSAICQAKGMDRRMASSLQ